jgi:hypothetical protein
MQASLVWVQPNHSANGIASLEPPSGQKYPPTRDSRPPDWSAAKALAKERLSNFDLPLRRPTPPDSAAASLGTLRAAASGTRESSGSAYPRAPHPHATAPVCAHPQQATSCDSSDSSSSSDGDGDGDGDGDYVPDWDGMMNCDGVWNRAAATLSLHPDGSIDSDDTYETSGLNSADVREVLCALSEMSVYLDSRPGHDSKVSPASDTTHSGDSQSCTVSGEISPQLGPGVSAQDSLLLLRTRRD